MRLYPPAWMQARFVAQECEIDGVRLPKGTMVILSQWVIHRLPDLWDDPDAFVPERWDPANDQKVPSGAYFPFGGGPRICIGMPFAQMEARLILANILQSYFPQPVAGYTPGRQALITLRPKRNLQVILSPINSTSTGSWTNIVNQPTVNGLERQGCLNAILSMFGLTSLLK